MAVAAIAAAAFAVSAARSEPATGIIHPGSIFRDIHQRRLELLEMGREPARDYCRPAKLCAYEPVAVIDADHRDSGETAAAQGNAYWSAVTDYLRTGSRVKLKKAKDHLLSWVEADSLRDIKGNVSLARHYLKRALFPTITAYAVMRDALPMPPAEQVRIEAWLGRAVTLADQDNVGGKRNSDVNNSRYLRDAVNMAWGILMNDQGAYEKGVDRIYAVLGQMRADGSLPWETRRGAHSLIYQNLALSILVPMAEMAAHQGTDLYSLNHEGKSLHTAIGFLIAAEADEALLAPYTRKRQKTRQLGNHLHWTAVYLARFSDHPNAQGLIHLRQKYGFLPGRGNDFSGGNLSCLFAKPQSNPVPDLLPSRRKPTELRPGPPPVRFSCPKILD